MVLSLAGLALNYDWLLLGIAIGLVLNFLLSDLLKIILLAAIVLLFLGILTIPSFASWIAPNGI